eukprot:SAG31_NODE_4297_length_3373_cov_3.080941_5_plen_91_part_00
MSVFNLRDVDKGELLTISYIPLEHAPKASCGRNARRERLRNDFFFDCVCELCQEEMEETKVTKLETAGFGQKVPLGIDHTTNVAKKLRRN